MAQASSIVSARSRDDRGVGRRARCRRAGLARPSRARHDGSRTRPTDKDCSRRAERTRRVVLWNVAKGLAIEVGGHTDRVTKVAFSPDGSRRWHRLATTEPSVSIDPTGRLVCRRSGHQAPVKGISFSHDSRHLCSVGADGEVRVWDTATGAYESRTAPADRDVFCSFSPDGTWLLSGSHTGRSI